MKLSKNTVISGLEAFSKEELIRILLRAFRPQKEKEAELLAVMKATTGPLDAALLRRGKRSWEYWAERGVTHVQKSDGTIVEVPKKPVKL